MEKKQRAPISRNARDNLELYAIMLPVIVLIFIFSYVPIYGVLIAFQDYMPGSPFIGPKVRWVGLKHFEMFVTSFYFPRILKNTLTLSLLNLAMGFWVPIVFALLLNEMRSGRARKTMQTISYMPHFISAVVMAGIVLTFISADGLVMELTQFLGIEMRAPSSNADAFKWVYTITNIWKGFGWSSILYLATISSIDPELYEAANIDGATRLKRIRYITLPFLGPLIMIQLIFSIGGLMGSNTELILLLYNNATLRSADVIGTYVYREGLVGGRFSFGSAANLLMTVLSFILIFSANKVSDKLTNFSLW